MLFFWRKKKIPKVKPDWAILGLGNPGEKYKNNRHNIGWMVAEELLKSYNTDFNTKTATYKSGLIKINDNNILVAVPLTYMNNSGIAAKEIIRNYNIKIENLIVVIDEYNFPLGRIHVKTGGGDGGHNGMASIIENLESTDFIKLRCGIDKNFGPGELVQYVLSDFNSNEIEIKDQMIKKAIIAIETIIKFGKAQAFSKINSGELWK